VSIGAIGRSVVWLVIGVVLATGGWLAVLGWSGRSVPNTDPRVLRSYNVRPEVAVEVRNALNTALGPFGQAGVAPNGQILVAAPLSFQEGVAQLLTNVASHDPSATPSIHVDAWFVTASPGSPVDSPSLKEIQPALHALEQSKGPMRFELLEELSTQAQSGESNSNVQGTRAGMVVSVSVLRDSQDHPLIAAQLRLHLNQGQGAITAQAELRPDELLVLGQSSFSDKNATDRQPTERQLYYIVRATL
jgi:hypothetical protein